jgi:nitrogen fixation protein FixH
MVGISMTKDVDLVANNYYEKEIKYQEQIDLLKKTNGLTENAKIEIAEGGINITFPEASDMKSIKGFVNFYRPSDSKKDFTIPVTLDENGMMKIGNDKLTKGLWKVRLSWESSGEKYFTEQTIIIQ